ncbi:uncharacterized protein LOC121368798 [Gigantopelta aegis]|uniref:uncharacterized protein LOC121368798 n=1 Tax=Gigantopelta aegis TaxID=1735272 RepID=UPI001B887E50|nr:uncharacterized protein LOC121368798 [Gigantopelta aegis]
MGCAASTPFPSTPITNQPLPKQHDHKTGRSSTPTREELPKNVKSSPTSKDNIDSHKEPGNIGTGLETYETAKTNSEVVGDDMREIHQVGEIKSTAIDSEQAHSSISQINSEVDLSRCEKCSDEPDNIKGFESGPGSTSAVHTHREADDNLDEANVDGMMHHKAKTKDGSENRDGDFEQSQAQNSASEKNVIEEKDIINTNESTWAELGRGSPIQRSGQEILDKNPGQTVNEQDTIAKSGQESLDKNPGQTVNEQDTIAKAEQESLDKNQGQTVNGRDTIAKSGQESSDKNPSQTVNNQDTIAKSVDESSIPCIPLSDPRHDGGTVKVQTIEDLKLNLLRGNVNVQCPRTAKIVRVFLSSTFTDTKNERDLLLDDAYTRMKKKCKAKGYEFQLVDMRWGVVQSIDNSHMTGEMCINEIEQCQKLSTGPNFVTLLSHKYGYFAYPRIIEKTKFEKLAEFISSEKSENSSESDLDLIKKWYILDENSTPPHYVLQAISTYFPDFMSSDKDVYKGTKRNWNKTCDRIVNILIDAAKQAFQDERFIIGVTEFEIQQGILENDKRADTCLWLKRQIKGLEEEVGKKHKNKYIDSIDGSDWAERNKKLMTHLVDELTEKLPKENVIPFSISWKPEAIDPIAYDEHKEYLGEFCFEFEEKVMKQFKEALKGSKVKELGDKLLEEIAQHTRLCQEKCRDFYGRAKELKVYQDI